MNMAANRYRSGREGAFELLEIPGMSVYTAEKLPENPQAVHAAWRIHGPRKKWVLIRNAHDPHMLFPVGDPGVLSSMSIRGIRWFTDRDGTLKPAR